MHLCQLVLPGMRERKSGWIVNMSSGAAILPDLDARINNGTIYGMCKAALERFSTGLATEARDGGIAVNAIRPRPRRHPGGRVLRHDQRRRTGTWSPRSRTSPKLRSGLPTATRRRSRAAWSPPPACSREFDLTAAGLGPVAPAAREGPSHCRERPNTPVSRLWGRCPQCGFAVTDYRPNGERYALLRGLQEGSAGPAGGEPGASEAPARCAQHEEAELAKATASRHCRARRLALLLLRRRAHVGQDAGDGGIGHRVPVLPRRQRRSRQTLSWRASSTTSGRATSPNRSTATGWPGTEPICPILARPSGRASRGYARSSGARASCRVPGSSRRSFHRARPVKSARARCCKRHIPGACSLAAG